jgi:RNA polymerase sigma factor (sigma-70 family)
MTALDDVPRADLALVADAREGQRDAFAELYRRHYDPAFRYALSLTRGDEALAQDLVAEAFAQVLRATFEGGGSTVAFRPYLFSAVRHEFLAERRRTGRVALVDDADALDSPTRPEEGADDSDPVIASAFGRLPARWRTVLWHMEIQGDKPAELARFMGISANAVAALASRAREGLRQEYLQEQVVGRRPECQPYASRLGRLVRGGLSRRERRSLEEHLAGCADCAQARADLASFNERLRCGLPVLGGLAPLLLGPGSAGTPGAGVSAAAGSGTAVSGAAASSVAPGGAAASGITASGCAGSIGAAGSGALGGTAVAAGTASLGAISLAPAGMAAGLAVASAAAVLGLSGVHAAAGVPDALPAAVATVSNEMADDTEPMADEEYLPDPDAAPEDDGEPDVHGDALAADGPAVEVMGDLPVEVTAEPTAAPAVTGEPTATLKAAAGATATGHPTPAPHASGSGGPSQSAEPTSAGHHDPGWVHPSASPHWSTGEPDGDQWEASPGGPMTSPGSASPTTPTSSAQPPGHSQPPGKHATPPGKHATPPGHPEPSGKHARPDRTSGPPEFAGPSGPPSGKHARR